MLTCISTAQARTKCMSAFWPQSGARHFSCKFPYKVALVKCWRMLACISAAQSAFRADSGLRTLGREIGGKLESTFVK